MVDCDANGAPLSGQRSTAIFISGSCRVRSRSMASSATAGDCHGARHHHLKHLVPDAVRIAMIRHYGGKPLAHPELAPRLSQQQTGCRR
jgi:hypothetical protein